MLFEIPKSLLNDAVGRVSPAFQPSSNPQDKGRYLIIKGAGNSFSAWVKRQELTAFVELSSDEIKIAKPFEHTLQGKPLSDMLKKNAVAGMIEADFEAIQVDEPEEPEGEDEGEPVQAPIPQIGNLLLLLPSTRKQPEKWRLPVVSWTAEPSIEKSGKRRLRVNAGELAALVAKVKVAYNQSSPAALRNVLVRKEGAKYQVVQMEQCALALGEGAVVSSSEDNFDICLGYDNLSAVVKMLVQDKEVEIIVNDGHLILEQDMEYGDKVVGRSVIRIACAKEMFSKFEKKLAKMDFRWFVKFKCDQMKDLCDKIRVFNSEEPMANFSPVGDEINGSYSGQQGSIERIAIDMIDSKGDPFDYSAAVRFWRSAADISNEEINVAFSGQSDLLLVNASNGQDNFKFYFMAYPPAAQ